MADHRAREVKRPSRSQHAFTLFVVGGTPLAFRAYWNLRSLCEELLPGRHEIEVVDLREEPEAARESGIVCTPTLFLWRPKPIRQLVGDLSDRKQVVRALGLAG